MVAGLEFVSSGISKSILRQSVFLQLFFLFILDVTETSDRGLSTFSGITESSFLAKLCNSVL